MGALEITLISLLLLGANAFFVAGEFALISARRSEIEPKARAGSFLARQTLWTMEHVSLMMATAQLGITLCTIALGALAKPALAYLFEDLFALLGLSQAAFYVVSVILALALIAFLHVVFSEMVPKNIALARPSISALLLSLPLRLFSYLVYPFVWSLNALANGILRLLRIEPRDEVASAFTRDEVSRLVDESRREGKLDNYEGHLLSSALSFEEKELGEIVIPLKDWIFASSGSTPGEIEGMTAQHGYSRFPVQEGEEILGYVHVKDALDVTRKGDPFPAERLHPLPHFSERDYLRKALEVMQRLDVHLGLVLDRRGRTLGLVTLEDVLEELIGEVRDAATLLNKEKEAKD